MTRPRSSAGSRNFDRETMINGSLVLATTTRVFGVPVVLSVARRRTVAIRRGQDREALVRQLGTDEYIDSNEGNAGEHWPDWAAPPLQSLPLVPAPRRSI
jgi:hypothetical protein